MTTVHVEIRCVKCACRIQPGQLHMPNKRAKIGGVTVVGPMHISCPNEREIAHAARMGRPL